MVLQDGLHCIETKLTSTRNNDTNTYKKQQEEQMIRQLKFMCKIEKNHVSYVSYIHTSHTKHTVFDLSNV